MRVQHTISTYEIEEPNKPHADARDSAFWDRLCPITFNLRFVDTPVAHNERKRDTSLATVLEAEASGILAWLVRGCLQWQANGLQLPRSIVQARATYREEEDTLGQFIQECCVIAQRAKAKSGQLYERYKGWSQENGLKAMSGTSFGLEMKKMFRWDRETKGYHYYGIGLLDETMNPPGEGFIGHKTRPEGNGEGSDTGTHEPYEPFFEKSPSIKDQKVHNEKFSKKGSWGSLAHQFVTHRNHPLESDESTFHETTKGS